MDVSRTRIQNHIAQLVTQVAENMSYTGQLRFEGLCLHGHYIALATNRSNSTYLYSNINVANFADNFVTGEDVINILDNLCSDNKGFINVSFARNPLGNKLDLNEATPDSGQRWRWLEKLDISGCKMSNKQIEHLVKLVGRYAPKCKSVNISNQFSGTGQGSRSTHDKEWIEKLKGYGVSIVDTTENLEDDDDESVSSLDSNHNEDSKFTLSKSAVVQADTKGIHESSLELADSKNSTGYNVSDSKDSSQVDDDEKFSYDSGCCEDTAGPSSSDNEVNAYDIRDSEDDIDLLPYPNTRFIIEEFKNTYFNEIENPKFESAREFCRFPKWKDFVTTISRMGELLQAPKNMRSLMILRNACIIMSRIDECEDLLNPDSDDFTHFWTRGRAHVSCIMQGGKILRAIALRGYVHGGVHDKTVVILTNSQAVAYVDMKVSLVRLEQTFSEHESKKQLIHVSHLNRKNDHEHYHELRLRNEYLVHVNVQLRSSRNIETMDQWGFNSENAMIILDESHAIANTNKYADAFVDRLLSWTDTTLVTATEKPSTLRAKIENIEGEPYTSVRIVPRPGYYVAGSNEMKPDQDNEDDMIYVVKYQEVLDAVDSVLDAPRTPFLVPFPCENIVSKMAARKQEISIEFQEQLRDICKRKSSSFHMVLNHFRGNASAAHRNSANVGHALIAKWLAQTTAREFKKHKQKCSVFSYAIYQSSQVTGFKRLKVYVNDTFLSKINSTKNTRLTKLKNLFTTVRSDNSKCLLPKSKYGKAHDWLRQFVDDAATIGKDKSKKTKKAKKMNHEVGLFTRVDSDIWSFEVPGFFDMESLLEFAKTIHEFRTQNDPEIEEAKKAIERWGIELNGEECLKVLKSFLYKKRPLKVFIVGRTLLKQSVNLQSKNREILLTGLTVLNQPSVKIGHTQLMQAVGRIDYGIHSSPFLVSAYGVDENPRVDHAGKLRPTVYCTERIKEAILNLDNELEKRLAELYDENMGEEEAERQRDAVIKDVYEKYNLKTLEKEHKALQRTPDGSPSRHANKKYPEIEKEVKAWLQVIGGVSTTKSFVTKVTNKMVAAEVVDLETLKVEFDENLIGRTDKTTEGLVTRIHRSNVPEFHAALLGLLTSRLAGPSEPPKKRSRVTFFDAMNQAS